MHFVTFPFTTGIPITTGIIVKFYMQGTKL